LHTQSLELTHVKWKKLHFLKRQITTFVKAN